MKSKVLGFFLISIFTFFLANVPAVYAEKTIRIGVAAPLQQEAGIGTKNTAVMATEEINAAGGILGHKIELFFADDGARPETGINAVKKLIFEDKVDLITGGWLSGVALAQADHIFAAKKLWLASGPGTPKLVEFVKKDYNRAKYFFRSGALNSDNYAKDIAIFYVEFFKNKLGITKVALLPESSVWSREISAYLESVLPQKGFDIVYMDVFDPGQTDFSAQFSQIRKTGAKVLLAVQAVSPGVPLTKQWADTKLPVHQAGYSAASQVFNFWDKTGGKCYGEVTQLVGGGGGLPSQKRPFLFMINT